MENECRMSIEYVQKQHDIYRITGSRVSLDSIVYAWQAGQSAETIAQSFQTLTLWSRSTVPSHSISLIARRLIVIYSSNTMIIKPNAKQRDAAPMFYQLRIGGVSILA